EERILEESKRLLELEGQVAVDMQLDQELTVFRQRFEEFEAKHRTANVKLEDIAFLRRQVEGLMPRLTRGATPEGRDEGAPEPGTAEFELPADESLTTHYKELIDSLHGTDRAAAPRDVALGRDVYHLRLEPR